MRSTSVHASIAVAVPDRSAAKRRIRCIRRTSAGSNESNAVTARAAAIHSRGPAAWLPAGDPLSSRPRSGAAPGATDGVGVGAAFGVTGAATGAGTPATVTSA